jgi:hypothetical protein
LLKKAAEAHCSMPPSALWSASPIVPDQPDADEVSTKLTVEVAEKTLGLIEEVLESTKAGLAKHVKKSVRRRDTVKEFIKNQSFGFFSLVAFVAVLIAGAVDLVTEIAECDPSPLSQ